MKNETTTNRKEEAMKNPTTIDLGCMSEKAAAKVYAALNGKTFMNFRVNRGVCPSGMAVTVETDYDDTLEEISGMAMHVLAEAM